MSRPVFLSADWRHLALLNYEVDPEVLLPHLPTGTELDYLNGKTYFSLVAFLFDKTNLFGILPTLFHRRFEEVNLRFYVTRQDEAGLKRGVVFVKEIVPKPFLAWTARTFYHENYVSMPMSHDIEGGRKYVYTFGDSHLKVLADGRLIEAAENSPERWITEHYWGYTRVSDTETLEYEVKHPVWSLYGIENFEVQIDIASLYGPEFVQAFNQGPSSVFLADGSEVTVHLPKRIQARG
ncbi:MAG: YqjF family protein [Bdellovibrionales bacterium]